MALLNPLNSVYSPNLPFFKVTGMPLFDSINKMFSLFDLSISSRALFSPIFRISSSSSGVPKIFLSSFNVHMQGPLMLMSAYTGSPVSGCAPRSFGSRAYVSNWIDFSNTGLVHWHSPHPTKKPHLPCLMLISLEHLGQISCW